jgi:hypothetical protein
VAPEGGVESNRRRTCRSVREKLDSAWCRGEPATEWRSPETRWVQTGNGPAGKVQNAKSNEREESGHGTTSGGWRQNDREVQVA